MSVPGARVSIIMRTKDRLPLLRRALDDVAAQTFDDWHLCLINDGGDPAPVDHLVAACPGISGRVTVIHQATSLGMEAASNAGLAASDSEFVCLHDDDDTWAPDFLSATVAYLTERPGDMGVVTRTTLVLERLEGDVIIETGREPFEGQLTAITLTELLRVNRFVPIALLYRRAVHDTLGPFRSHLPVVGDWDFHLRLAAAFPVGLLDAPLAFWHRRPAASGAASNSVDDGELHRTYDLLVRDGYLREHVADAGLGGVLYLTRFLADEFEGLHRRLDDLQRRVDAAESATRETGLIALARRKYYRVRHRVLTSLGREP